ncbi:hypothetical protein D920_01508 [Enterococcus faecalis 13-SD-W-01]|nr:hypothetical protein D920_01508 [Enterococcus faecalis 13-SD-W-01]
MNCLTTSSNEETSKTAFHVLLVFELLPKWLVHEHRLLEVVNKAF